METVKVIDSNKENKRGWKIINKDDMAAEDKEYKEQAEKKKKAEK